MQKWIVWPWQQHLRDYKIAENEQFTQYLWHHLTAKFANILYIK